MFVLDCSVTVAWCFGDEDNIYALHILNSLKGSKAIVPSLWSYEVSNALLMAVKRKRLSESDVFQFLESLSQLPIEIKTSRPFLTDLFMISQKYGLTAYDGAYLELCLSTDFPLATNDANLSLAVQNAGGSLHSM